MEGKRRDTRKVHKFPPIFPPSSGPVEKRALEPPWTSNGGKQIALASSAVNKIQSIIEKLGQESTKPT